MLNLDENKPAIKELILSSIKRFIESHPEVTVTCAALYSSPSEGWVLLNFDSVESTQRFLTQWSKNGDAWIGKDRYGRFNNSCPDYDHNEFGRIDFDEWIDEYENQSIPVIMSRGRKHKINLERSGDEKLNKVFFQWLKSIVKELEKEGAFSNLQKADIFRLGVQMLDSKCEAFWVSKK